MTTVGTDRHSGRLDYWRLSPAERRQVRRIERTSRAVGDGRLDAVAAARLERSVRRARLLGPLARWLGRRDPQHRLDRLRSTCRHPSRCGGRVPGAAGRPSAGTS